ncbi:hypothetical protein N2152v2_002271 [Parachlorella kessleri]
MFKLLSKRQREGRKRHAGAGELDSARPTEADETESLGSDSSLLALLDEGWFQQGAGGTGSRHSSRPSSRPGSRADSVVHRPQQPYPDSAAPSPALSKEGHAASPSRKATPALDDLQPASREASSSHCAGAGLGVAGSNRSGREAAGVPTLPQQPATPTGTQLAVGSATTASEASVLEHSQRASASMAGLGWEGVAESTAGSPVVSAERLGTPSVGSGWDSPRSWSTSQLSLPQVHLETMDLAQLESLAAEAAQLQQRAALAMKFARQQLAVALCELVVLLGLGFVFAAVAQVQAWAVAAATAPIHAAHAVVSYLLHLWAVMLGVALSLVRA